MSKSSKETILHNERKVMDVLAQNGKESVDWIAKQCRFSRQKVSRIIKDLEKRKIIWGYAAIVDEEQKGLSHFTILIKRTLKPLDNEIMKKIDSLQLEDIAKPVGVEIESSCLVHGCYDWIISFNAKDILTAKKFSDMLCNGFPGAIMKLDLVESLYFVRKQNIFNPTRKKLKDIM